MKRLQQRAVLEHCIDGHGERGGRSAGQARRRAPCARGRGRGRTQVSEAVELELLQRLVLLAVVVLIEPPGGLHLEQDALAALQIFRRAVENEPPAGPRMRRAVRSVEGGFVAG